jgi:hypothetical protein
VREFGELESAIMDVVWAGDRGYLVREVRERLDYNRAVAYTTVMTVMNILHGKGVLRWLRCSAPAGTGGSPCSGSWSGSVTRKWPACAPPC